MPGFSKPLGKEGKAKLKQFGSKVKNAVVNKLKERKMLDDMASEEMDKMYPAGWAQSSVNMIHHEQLRKEIKKRLKNGL